MFAGLIKLVFLFVLVYFAYLVLRVYRAATRPRQPSPPKQVRGEMVKDDVCNTYIPKDEAIREVRGGRERFYCSEECRRKSPPG